MSSYWKRLLILSRIFLGIVRSIALLAFRAARTMVREKSDEPYCVSLSPCAESEISVSVTCIAFFEVQSVTIMMTPAVISTRKLAGTLAFSPSIRIVLSPA